MLTREQQDLVHRCMWVVDWWCKKRCQQGAFRPRSEASDEFRAECMMGLVLAAASYDPSRHTKFETWAVLRIGFHLSNTERAKRGRRGQRSLPVDGEGVPLDAIADHRRNDPSYDITMDDLWESVVNHRKLEPMERVIVSGLLSGNRAKELAEFFGISAQALSQRMKQLKPKLRRLVARLAGDETYV